MWPAEALQQRLNLFCAALVAILSRPVIVFGFWALRNDFGPF